MWPILFLLCPLFNSLPRRKLGDHSPEELHILIVQFLHQCCSLFDHLFFVHVAPPIAGREAHVLAGLSVSSPYIFIIEYLFGVKLSNYAICANFLPASVPGYSPPPCATPPVPDPPPDSLRWSITLHALRNTYIPPLAMYMKLCQLVFFCSSTPPCIRLDTFGSPPFSLPCPVLGTNIPLPL